MLNKVSKSLENLIPRIISMTPSLTVLVVFGLTIGSSFAEVCFEGTPLQTFRGPLFSIQGQESDGQLCATVVRDEADVDDEDFETFQFSTFVVTVPVFGDGSASAGADYTAVSGVTVNFPEGSINVTICVYLILDDFACEGRKDFGIQLLSTNSSFNTVCNTPRAIATIEDSTAIHIGFTSSTAEVSEDAGSVPLSVTRFSGTQNFNPAQVVVMEDPDTPGCLASSWTITYPCVAKRCSETITFDLTKDIESQANPRLVDDDDDVIDGHKECQIFLRPMESTCLFNFTRERMQLIVRDNERFLIALSSDFYQEEEDEGGVDVTVVVRGLGNVPITVSQPVDFTLSIRTDGVNDPVEGGVDLPNITYTSSIPPGQSSTSVKILFTPDDVYESIEKFKLLLMPSEDRYNLIPSVPSADVQIANDDSVTVQFPQNLTVQESDGELTFALLTEQEYEEEICVFVRARSASTAQLSGDLQLATANKDFIPNRSEVCFRDNSRTSENFTVPILGASDNIPEFDKVFSVTVELGPENDPTFFNLPDRPATVIYVDNSDPYVLQFSQPCYRVVENTGAIDVTVTVDRPPAFDIPFTVVASVSGSGPEYATLSNGFRSDILSTEWNSTIASGQENATFSIDILVDNLAEFDEQFNITLTVLRNPRLAVSNQDENVALVVIEDDDEVLIAVDTAERSREGVDMVHNITFTAVGFFAVPFSVNVMFIDGTAENGSDYDGTLQKVTFTPSDTVQIVSVPILNDDEREGDENFQFLSKVDSSRSVGLSVNTIQAMGAVIISDNEAINVSFLAKPPQILTSEGSVITLVVARWGKISQEISLAIRADKLFSNAVEDEDYHLNTSTITFSNAESTYEEVSIFIQILQDNIQEIHEHFFVTLGATNGIQFGTQTVAVIINDPSTTEYIRNRIVESVLPEDLYP